MELRKFGLRCVAEDFERNRLREASFGIEDMRSNQLFQVTR
jgi:hypothetical protein